MKHKKPEQSKEPTQGTQPGSQEAMRSKPEVIRKDYRGSGKLEGRRACITGGDSGIGRAIAVHFAREGAEVAIVHLHEHDDAQETKSLVEAEGRRCVVLRADLADSETCRQMINSAASQLGGMNILVNNIAQQYPVESPEKLSAGQIELTFRTNVFSYYHCAIAALAHLPRDGVIINTSSITGSRGHKKLLDYAATKGAIDAMTASFAGTLIERGIRVNAVAPGPVWTPLIPSSFDEEDLAKFGKDTPMGRPAQPSEIAPAYVFLASEDASYITGLILHVNGGEHIDV